jgi:hypothetical protein
VSSIQALFLFLRLEYHTVSRPYTGNVLHVGRQVYNMNVVASVSVNRYVNELADRPSGVKDTFRMRACELITSRVTMPFYEWRLFLDDPVTKTSWLVC